MRRLLLAALLLTGCAKPQDMAILDTVSSDSWRVVVATRGRALQPGTNYFVVGLQDPQRTWVKPGDVNLEMTMSPSRSDAATQPQKVSLQPDGELGHYLAIADLPTPDLWKAHLSISTKGVEYGVDFSLSNGKPSGS